MATDGTSFDIDLGISGAADYSAAAVAVETLAKGLAHAQSQAAQAADAVKQGEASYRAAESAADATAKALERLSLASEANRAKMAAAMAAGDERGFWRAAGAAEKLAEKQSAAAAAADAAKQKLASEAAALDKLKAASSSAGEAQGALAKKLGTAKEAAGKLAETRKAAEGTGNLGKLSGALGQLGGPLGAVGQKATGAADALTDLSETLGATGPYVAAAVVVVALTTAILSATAAATAWGVSLADAARSQALLSDGIAGSVAGGRELDATIKNLEKRVPQTSDELRGMAANLAKTGLKGQALSDALEDAAVKAAKLKFGPDFEKGAISLNKLSLRLKSNIGSVFSGLKIEGLLKGMSKIVDLFDESTATGRAMKVVFESLFQPIVDGATAFLPKVRSAFIQLEILVLKALIAIKPYGSTLAYVGKQFLVIAAVAVGLFVGAIVLATVVLGGLVAVGLAVGNMIAKAIVAFANFAASVISGLQPLRDLSLTDIGEAMIGGLVAGIVNAGPRVLAALGGIVTSAVDTAKKKLGIASPSKVFAEIGAQTAEGMAGGVEGGTGQVTSALEQMTAPPAASGELAAGGGGGGGAVDLSGATFNFYGVEGAEDAESRFGALLTRLLEGDVAQLGEGVPT